MVPKVRLALWHELLSQVGSSLSFEGCSNFEEGLQILLASTSCLA